jgi:hypothetical protein
VDRHHEKPLMRLISKLLFFGAQLKKDSLQEKKTRTNAPPGYQPPNIKVGWKKFTKLYYL